MNHIEDAYMAGWDSPFVGAEADIELASFGDVGDRIAYAIGRCDRALLRASLRRRCVTTQVARRAPALRVVK